jgi:AcrR family transcriptional regulator
MTRPNHRVDAESVRQTSASRSAPVRRSRRSREEVMATILEVAARNFATRGLSGTRILDIAEQANVSTATLYTYFRSKEELFSVASLEPFIVFAQEMGNLWDEDTLSRTGDFEITEMYISTLYQHLKENATSIRAVFLASRDPHAAGVAKLAHREFAKVMRRLEGIAIRWVEVRGGDMPDTGLRVRATVSLVVSTALLGDWFYGPMTRPKERAVLATIVDMVFRANLLAV